MKALETLKKILSSRVDVSNITDETDLYGLGLDSIDFVEITLEIEDAFSIEFTSDEVFELKTIRDLKSLIERKTNKSLF